MGQLRDRMDTFRNGEGTGGGALEVISLFQFGEHRHRIFCFGMIGMAVKHGL
jgi:hypothetical protein